VADAPNVVAVKAEGGLPSIACFAHLRLLLGDEVLLSLPIEDLGIPLATIVETPWMGTSNMEYYGSSLPDMLALVQKGDPTAALETFWKIAPARAAARATKSAPGANVAHRMVWKYMAWLNGYNGGPVRMPTMRIVPGQMKTLRGGLENSGLAVADGDDGDFFVGRVAG
jgi:4-hydroxy-tetrahydrodipicolinate synthase